MRKIYFCTSFTNKYPSGLAGCSCEQADLFCSRVVPLVGCERFSSPKNLDMGQCSGTGAHIKTTVPCPTPPPRPCRWWQVPLTTSWGRMGWHQKAICMGTEESNLCGWGHSLQLRWQWKAPFGWRTPKCWLQHLGQGKHKGLPSGHLPAQARRQNHAWWGEAWPESLAIKPAVQDKAKCSQMIRAFPNLGDFLFRLMEDQFPFLGLASQGGLCSKRQQKSFFKTHFSVVLLPQGLSEHRVDGGASVWARSWWWCQGLSILATGLMWCLMKLMGKKKKKSVLLKLLRFSWSALLMKLLKKNQIIQFQNVFPTNLTNMIS